MSKQSFASLIVSKIKSAVGNDGSKFTSSTPMQINTAISLACQEYIIDNTKISVSYTGVIPGTPPVPDITTDMEKVMGTVAPISGNNFSSWILSLETNIISGLFIAPGTALVTPLAPTPAFMKGLSISQSDLYSATGDENKDAQRIAWETICDKIIMWINSTPNAGLSYPSSHVASTGTSTIIKTTIV